MSSGLAAWDISEKDFPEEGSIEEKLTFCVRYAILAPSSLNTQPWKYAIKGNTVSVFMDRRYGLATIDPDDRELMLSAAASLYMLKLAARYFGYTVKTELAPDPKNSGLLARVQLGEKTEDIDSVDKKLFPFITKWRFNRGVYEGREIPEDILDNLRSAAADEGGWVHVCTEQETKTVARLIAEGDHIQMGSKNFRRELASWLNYRRAESRDGLPEHSIKAQDLMDSFAPLIVRRFESEMGGVVPDHQIAEGCPSLLVLGSKSGSVSDRICAGQALARLILQAHADGLSVSYLNHPCEVPELRLKLHDEIGYPGRAQVILRIGYGLDRPKPNPRRALSQFLAIDGKADHGLQSLDAYEAKQAGKNGLFGKIKRLFVAN